MEKQELKVAIREVFDEMTAGYCDGAGRFSESYTKAMAALIDAFDEFFTQGLLNDPSREARAKVYVDARLVALERLQEIVTDKLRRFETYRVQLTDRKQKDARAAVKGNAPKRSR